MRAACRREALSSTSFARRNSSHISARHREEIRKYITRARGRHHLRVRNRNRARTGFLLHHRAQGSFPSSRVMFIARRSSWCVYSTCSRAPRAPPRDLRRDRPDLPTRRRGARDRPEWATLPPASTCVPPGSPPRPTTSRGHHTRTRLSARAAFPLPRTDSRASRRTSGNPSPSSRSSLRPRTRSFAVDSPPARARRRVPGVRAAPGTTPRARCPFSRRTSWRASPRCDIASAREPRAFAFPDRGATPRRDPTPRRSSRARVAPRPIVRRPPRRRSRRRRRRSGR